MTQSRRTIEHLLTQGSLPLEHADTAATHLEIFPTKRSWLAFFDKTLLVIGVVALVLSLVFFIAYNWLHMGKMGKFALVEGALVITITLYVLLSFRRRFTFIRQLLLLIASVITGSLLALFGQVYQTGADTWQLFFSWALLIIPWVLIARLPALWLLWLGLINASLILYLDIADFLFIDYTYQSIFQLAILALVNFIAFNLWLIYAKNKLPVNKISINKSATHAAIVSTNDLELANSRDNTETQSKLHWSTYIVGFLNTYFITHLAIVTVFDDGYVKSTRILTTLISLLLWASWCGFIYWRFCKRRTDLLMLTYLCFSIIVVVMFWTAKLVLDDFDAGGFLVLALLLIGMSSMTIMWLRKVANLGSKNPAPHSLKGGGHE
ncbi:DUF2157 domain-containing protein [Psychrobacter sp. P2G3]|uniref:DUF2157 domain-containing protein n=1 Tax=Psychrobacter sp. P2G3 TaxID=1699622 RepID=UPI00082F7D07|nr:DUF2157 domain-containing protein [Psychrobacter sp. P2G3]